MRTIALLFALLFCTLAFAQDKPSPAAESFSQMKSLVGEWSGTYQWSGGRNSGGQITVRYRMTGMGSALVEDLIQDGTPTMTTIYHLDGNDLRMTHYCGAQNQPRLKASQIDMAKKHIVFDFVDITNLKAPDAPHVYGFEMEMPSPTKLQLTFLFEGAGKQSRELISLTRAATASEAPNKN